MSDTKSFRFSGDDDDYKVFKANTIKSGMTVEERLSEFIKNEVETAKKENTDDLKTASRYQDELTEKIY